MDRVGDSKVPRMDIAFYACKGAPAAIQPGAVLQMAEALGEANKLLWHEGYTTSQPEVKDIENSLAAYYGEDQ